MRSSSGSSTISTVGPPRVAGVSMSVGSASWKVSKQSLTGSTTSSYNAKNIAAGYTFTGTPPAITT